MNSQKKKSFASWLYHDVLGWKSEVNVPDFDKCIVCAAPHTSNWDLIYGKLFYRAINRQTGFMMKKSWFFFPLGAIFRAMGGIPVDRKKRTSLVEQMKQQVAESKTFHVAITPEGTRQANPRWKKGFYYIALGAQIPIVLVSIDYKLKTIKMNEFLVPTGDFEADMKKIKDYYRDATGKHPERFAL